MALPGELPANDGAPRRAEDDAPAGGEGGGMNAGSEGQDGGLEQKRPDHNQGDAILVSAQPAHRLC